MTMDTQSLITRYRPNSFDMVLGQERVVKALQSSLQRHAAQAYLFDGPSGTGKTTLARIAAAALTCDSANLTEIDAATHTGIEAMRELATLLNYRPFSGGAVRVVIVDECHALSAPAWKSLLKAIEEPPPYLYWFFCTTELLKVPPTIRTRCAAYHLRIVDKDTLFDLLQAVVSCEELKVPDAVLDVAVKAAYGSPRQALANLSVCATCTTPADAAALLRTVESEQKEVIDFCRLLTTRALEWKDCVKFMASFGDKDPESIRLTVLAYFCKILSQTQDAGVAARVLTIMEAFSEPCDRVGSAHPLWLAMGRLTFEKGAS